MRQFFFIFFLVLPFSVFAQSESYQIDTIVDGLDEPWGLAFLPDGNYLITERTGNLRLVKDAELVAEPVAGVPPIYYAGQGGLMDIVLHPDYAKNQMVYLSLAVGTPQSNALRIIRGTFDGRSLQNVETIFEAAPFKDTPVHYGGRMTFLPDQSLLVTVGDGFDYREQAQNLGNHFGTIIRVMDDGHIPADNPFSDNDTVQPEIWSYGHRNAQSIIYDPASKQVFMTEHGPQGGDELNLIEAGGNYGWPIATYGLDYSGAKISPYTEYEGTISPLTYWVPSIAPSGMIMYDGDAFPQWQGDILMTSLVFNRVERVDMEGAIAGAKEPLFTEIEDRLRDIRQGADGLIYLLAEGESGRLLRVSPK